MEEEENGDLVFLNVLTPAEINAGARRQQTYIEFGNWKPDLPDAPQEEPKDESPKPLDPSLWRF